MADAAGRSYAAFYANLKAQLGNKSASDLLDELDSKLEGEGSLSDEEIKAYMDLITELEPEPENPAFEAFTQDYIDRGRRSVPEGEPVKPRRSFRGVAGILVAAVILIMAFGSVYGGDLWNAMINADGDILHVNSGKLVLDKPGENKFHSLEKALEVYNVGNMTPAWIPEEFVISSVEVVELAKYDDISAVYISESNQSLVIRVMAYRDKIPDVDYEMVQGTEKEYVSGNGRKSVITENNGQYAALIEDGKCYCSITGDLSEKQIKKIIDSIGEGWEQ